MVTFLSSKLWNINTSCKRTSSFISSFSCCCTLFLRTIMKNFVDYLLYAHYFEWYKFLYSLHMKLYLLLRPTFAVRQLFIFLFLLSILLKFPVYTFLSHVWPLFQLPILSFPFTHCDRESNEDTRSSRVVIHEVYRKNFRFLRVNSQMNECSWCLKGHSGHLLRLDWWNLLIPSENRGHCISV